MNQINVREIEPSDINLIADYWLLSDPEHLVSMGVDLDKLPKREELVQMLSAQLEFPDSEKQSLAMIAVLNNEPIGHCNVNQIKFNLEATMHLHIWKDVNRQKGLGSEMVRSSIPIFFDRLKLKRLYCEPYFLNKAPNKTLTKIGFKLVKTHKTIPGTLNFEQLVNRYEFLKADLNNL